MINNVKLSGLWRSKYEYYSTSRREQFTSEQTMTAHVEGRHLILETLPDSKSYIFIRLTIDGNTATGTWYEVTDPEGYYKGTTYHGALQLISNESTQKFKGKWIGFGKNFDVKDGPWELTRVSD